MNIQAITAAITASKVLGEEEKKILFVLVPFMKEEGLQKLAFAFDFENELFTATANLTENLKQQAADLFDAVFESFTVYKKEIFRREEAKFASQDMAAVDDLMNNL